MASKRMLPHAVVLRNYIGEDNNGEAQYLPAFLSFVYVERLRKVSSGGVGLNPDDKIRLFVFDGASIVTDENGERKTFASPEAWESMTAAQRATAWTTQDGKDKIDAGDETYTIVSVDRFRAGSHRMWHWEVYGK